MIIRGTDISLRPPRMSDAPAMLLWESQQDSVKVSSHEGVFKLKDIQAYIQGIKDVYLDKQLRLVICDHSDKGLGCVDLFDVDMVVGKAAIGILIAAKCDRGKGLASEALQLLVEHSFHTLGLSEIIADVQIENKTSLNFFVRNGFEKNGMNQGIHHLIRRKKVEE